ncbi:MAG: heavy metal translocating P-type ATPase [Ilumatobacteraceae bacterium]
MNGQLFNRARKWSMLSASLFGLLIGAVQRLAGTDRAGSVAWVATTVLGIALSSWWVLDAARRRRLGVDLIALVALVGTLVVGEHLAGAVITVMLASGRSLEAWAAGRAERELHALMSRAPRTAHRYHMSDLTQVPLEQVLVGDLLLVQPGEVVPVDGVVRAGPAVIDDSALTGESIPVEYAVGETVRGGATNAGGPFDLLATTNATNSTYAGIVRLVQQASASTSPFVRTADRFALVFVAVTFAAAGATWLVAGDLARAVAVLVVATPCPLILAAPVAIVAGLSRAARRGVVVKGGAVLEALADSEILLFDKTGTVTTGRPTVADVITAPAHDSARVLQLAASLDQVSPHVLAAAIVQAARQRGLELSMPTGTEEVAGRGVRGLIDGHEVAVGNGVWAHVVGDEQWVVRARQRSEFDGALTVFVAIDGVAIAALILTDPIRPDAAHTIRRLRRSGITRVVMVTGDRAEVAASVGRMIGVDDVQAQQTPGDKVDVVRRESRRGSTIMVGDGINDAPALAAARVGVAMGSRGATASSETADIVLTVDRLDRLGEAHLIARRSRTIATQSVVVGMALSLVAMAFAAAGLLPATSGAVLQEVIDLAVILNALRALRPGSGERRLDETGSLVAQQFSAEHLDLRPQVELLRIAADRLGELDVDPCDAMTHVRRAHEFLIADLEPHELAEDRDFYPVVASVLGGDDPTVTMSRTHAEISRMTNKLGVIIERVGNDRPAPADVRDLQRLLYGLYAVVELHMSQEEESYLSLARDDLP